MNREQQLIAKLAKVRIVLVGTSHPGNIGATARAMKTMGLSRLVLVNPQLFPHQDATALASGAGDILNNAQLANSLQAAIADCQLVIGVTARERSIGNAAHLVSEVGAQCWQQQAEVALVFGNERAGLNNAELDKCQKLLTIPTCDNFSSLNLAQAVQIVCYELRKNSLQCLQPVAKHKASQLDQVANATELEYFYRHMQQWLQLLGFLEQTNPMLILRRMRGLFNRARPTVRELNILRGAFSASEKKLGPPTATQEE